MQAPELNRETAKRIRALRQQAARERDVGNTRAMLAAWYGAVELDPRVRWYELIRLGQLLNMQGMRKRSVACLRRAMAMPGREIAPLRFTPGSEPDGTLVIGFTVFNGVMSGMRFDFWGESGLGRHDRLELWDARFQAFFGGLPPLADNYEELLALLKQEVAKRAPRRLILTGSSGSGFAAILFGRELGADAVYAFSPARYYDHAKVAEFEPETAEILRGLFAEISALPLPDRSLLDLREVLRKDNGKSRYYIHYGSENALDLLRMRHLEGLPGVTLFAHPTRKHMVASWLGNAGLLRDLIAETEALAGRAG